LVAGAIWWIARRRRLAPVPEVPPEPAEVVALRELAALEADHLVANGRFEEFYVRGSHILREYAGRRFALPILDYTTTETLEAMRANALADRFAQTVVPLLGAADEVKFARHEPDQSDGDYWLREAREFVNASTPVAKPEQDVDDDAEPAGVDTRRRCAGPRVICCEARRVAGGRGRARWSRHCRSSRSPCWGSRSRSPDWRTTGRS
jgi:hypothetical protein